MNKEEIKAKATSLIDEVAGKIQALKDKKANAEESAKKKYDSAIAELERKKSDYEKKFSDFENASEEKWEETKMALSAASSSFKEGVDKIKSIF